MTNCSFRPAHLFAALVFSITLLTTAMAETTRPLDANNDDSIAIIIGNKSYRQTVPVDFAHNDADAMKEFLVAKLGFRDSNIFVLKDATLNEFNQMFGTDRNPQSGQIWRAAKPGRSNIFVYYSGHGAPDMQTHQPYLLPADGNPNQSESGYLLETLYRNLDLVKTRVGNERQVIVMIDACFTGETGRKGETLLAVSAPGFAPALPKASNGVIKLLATSATSPANWDNENSLGLFTSNFLLAASGLARADDARDLTWSSLKKYVVDGVRDKARRASGRDQSPEIDDAPISLKADGPVAAIRNGYDHARDDVEWRKAEANGGAPAIESYLAHCGTACNFRDRAIAMLEKTRNVGAARQDEVNWKKYGAEGRYQDYLDNCGAVCAYRDLAETYLAKDDPSHDPRVKRCDKLAGAGFDPDRPKEVRRVCSSKIDTQAAVAACSEAAKAFPKLRRLHHQLGRAYDAAGRFKEANASYKIAGDLGSAVALNNLAALMENGEGVSQNLSGAFDLYQKAAEAGSITAMSNIARLQEYGRGGPKNVSSAARWYKKCGDAGDAFCATKYANMVLSRVPGVEGDGLNAILTIRKSSDAGETMAMTAMAVIIDNGFQTAAGVGGTSLDYLKKALKRGERGAIAVATPAVLEKLKPQTKIDLQKLLKSAGAYNGSTDGRLSPAFVNALKSYAIAQEKTVQEGDFPEAGETCD